MKNEDKNFFEEQNEILKKSTIIKEIHYQGYLIYDDFGDYDYTDYRINKNSYVFLNNSFILLTYLLVKDINKAIALIDNLNNINYIYHEIDDELSIQKDRSSDFFDILSKLVKKSAYHNFLSKFLDYITNNNYFDAINKYFKSPYLQYFFSNIYLNDNKNCEDVMLFIANNYSLIKSTFKESFFILAIKFLNNIELMTDALISYPNSFFLVSNMFDDHQAKFQELYNHLSIEHFQGDSLLKKLYLKYGINQFNKEEYRIDYYLCSTESDFEALIVIFSIHNFMMIFKLLKRSDQYLLTKDFYHLISYLSKDIKFQNKLINIIDFCFNQNFTKNKEINDSVIEEGKNNLIKYLAMDNDDIDNFYQNIIKYLLDELPFTNNYLGFIKYAYNLSLILHKEKEIYRLLLDRAYKGKRPTRLIKNIFNFR